MTTKGINRKLKKTALTIVITLVVIGGGGMHYSIDYKMKAP